MQNRMPITLELCVDSVESSVAAEAGGADRIELCCALAEGGLTPSAGMIHAVRRAVALPVFVLIRPRGGDFHYSSREFCILLDDVRRARDLGADGVVSGILDAAGAVDVERMAALVASARPMQVTFHRALDVSRDLSDSLERVVLTGADRILTSGGQASGVDGADMIAALRAQAGRRIQMLGCGGIRTSNAREFVRRTGVREVHTSLRAGAESSERGQDALSRLGMGESGGRPVVATTDVRAMRGVLDALG